MKQEIAEFKARKQAPAKELHERDGTKLKGSSKKPWRFDNSWKPEAKFTHTVWLNGLSTKSIDIVKTYKQIKEEVGRSDFFYLANWKPAPHGNYKSKKSALQAWENFKLKGVGFGSPAYNPNNVNYKLVNIESGEEIIL